MGNKGRLVVYTFPPRGVLEKGLGLPHIASLVLMVGPLPKRVVWLGDTRVRSKANLQKSQTPGMKTYFESLDSKVDAEAPVKGPSTTFC